MPPALPALFENFNSANEDFSSWLERFNCYIECSNVPETNYTKFFIASIGGETYATLKKLVVPSSPASLDYETITEKLVTHYNPKPLVDVSRHTFRSRLQKDGESFNDFLAALKALSRNCEFNDNARLEEELKAQLIAGVNDKSIQAYCFATPKLTLQNIIDKAVAAEQAAEGVDHFRTTVKMPEIVGNVQKINERVVKKNVRDKNSFQSKSHHHCANSRPVNSNKFVNSKNFKQDEIIVCYRCARKNHKASECRFANSSCNSCNQVGHLANVCGKSHSEIRDSVLNKFKSNSVKSVSTPQIVDIARISVVTDCDNPPAKIYIPIEINNRKINIESDSGSDFTIMSLRQCKLWKLDSLMQPYHRTLETYNHSSVHVIGLVPVQVKFRDRNCNLQLRILEEDLGTVMGRDWILAMNIDIREFAKTPSKGVVNQISPKIDLGKEIQNLINEFSELFENESIGHVPNFTVDVKLKSNSKPIFCRARAVPYSLRDNVIKEIDRLVAAGVYTQTTTSDWATPVVLVIKANGTLRLVGDYSVTVNKCIQPEDYPIPNIEEIINDFNGCQYFSKFDIKEAYMHLPVTEETSKILTVNTIKGLYYVNRMNYGLQSAPAVWQRFVEQLFSEIDGCKCFFDDIKISSSNFSEHCARVRKFFTICKANNICLNRSKCEFLTDQLVYLGFKIDKDGIHKTSGKIEAIKNAPRPRNTTEMKAFSGLVAYYARFIPNMSHIMSPLRKLLRKNARFHWSSECERAFQAIKNEIISDRVLCHFDINKNITLATDASPNAIGAVISHVDSHGERPIAFASRSLTDTESRYSQLDKESLAIYWGIKKFFNYLYGRKFTLFTDCRPLQSIFNAHAAKPSLSATRLLHYALFLQGFDYDIKFRKSTENANADFVSRFPALVANPQQIDTPAMIHQVCISNLPVTANEIAQATLADPELSSLLRQLKGEEKCRMKANILAEYSLLNDCILRNDRVYIPKKLRAQVLQELHVGHFGIVKTKMLARSHIYWPGLDNDIECLVKSCKECAENAKNPAKLPPHPWEPTKEPWQRIHFDVGQVGDTYLFIIVDSFSKWIEVYPLKSTTESIIIDCLDDCFSKYGCPLVVVSDNAPQFKAPDITAYFRNYGIKHYNSPPHHPQSNGQAERAVQTVKDGIKTYRTGPLVQRIRQFLAAYRRTPHVVTHESPYKLMFGREMRTRLTLVRPIMVKHSKAANGHPRKFMVDERVQYRLYAGGKRWATGKITKKCGNVVYEIHGDHDGRVIHRHTNQLRTYSGPPELPPINALSPDEPEVEPVNTNPATPRLDRPKRHCGPPKRFSPQ